MKDNTEIWTGYKNIKYICIVYVIVWVELNEFEHKEFHNESLTI